MENEEYKLLKNLNVEYSKQEHPPLFTCNDNKKYNIKFDATVCKNLFIQNSSKSKYYLIVLPIEKKIDLKSLQSLLEETRLSFCNEKILEEKLGVKSGAVSIFNVTNLKDKDVMFILDNDILTYKKVAFPANINTETIIINPREMNKILEYYNAKFEFIKL